jgi:hypothetical protein
MLNSKCESSKTNGRVKQKGMEVIQEPQHAKAAKRHPSHLSPTYIKPLQVFTSSDIVAAKLAKEYFLLVKVYFGIPIQVTPSKIWKDSFVTIQTSSSRSNKLPFKPAKIAKISPDTELPKQITV